jgi:hypothetical protein
VCVCERRECVEKSLHYWIAIEKTIDSNNRTTCTWMLSLIYGLGNLVILKHCTLTTICSFCVLFLILSPTIVVYVFGNDAIYFKLFV